MNKFLTEWAANYFKHRDILTEKIEKIKTVKEGLQVINKDGTEKYILIAPFLSEFKPLLQDIEGKDIAIVVFNNRDNFNAMLNEWDELVKHQKLSVIFVNPFSMTDTKWLISPYFHNKIADPESLKSGLKSLFSSVEEISKEEAEKKI